MESLFEHNDGTYCKQGDYLIPILILSTKEENDIGIYGKRHLRYLQEYQKLTYINLLTNGNLYKHLDIIDNQAYKRFSRIVEQMKQEQEITEQLKEDNPIEWTRKMNCIRQQVEEIVLNEVIYNYFEERYWQKLIPLFSAHDGKLRFLY